MKIVKLFGSTERRSISSRQIAAAVALAWLVFSTSAPNAAPRGSARDQALQGTASLSGTVEAAKPFKAAQVFIRNVDKRMLYMVYTNAGKFRAVALLPGNYEINVQARGLESDVQKLVIKAGDRPDVKLSMRDASTPDLFPSASPVPPRNVTLQSYNEIYPPGPGKQVLEEVCMVCHGEHFFPMRPRNEAGWQAALDLMMGKNLFDRDRVNSAEGILAPPATGFRFGLQDRKDVLAYLIKNFGPDSKPRAVRSDRDVPLDEAKLAKAQFIEYFLEPNPTSQTTTGVQPQGEIALSRNRIMYTAQL